MNFHIATNAGVLTPEEVVGLREENKELVHQLNVAIEKLEKVAVEQEKDPMHRIAAALEGINDKLGKVVSYQPSLSGGYAGTWSIKTS